MLFSVIKNGLVPHDDAARSSLSKLKIGAVVDVEILNPIHTKFNNKIMVTIAALAKARHVNFAEMKATLLVETGRFDIITLCGAAQRKVLVVKSMSRSAMTQSEREMFWDELRAIATAQILPALDEVTAADIREMMDGRQVGITETDHGNAQQ